MKIDGKNRRIINVLIICIVLVVIAILSVIYVKKVNIPLCMINKLTRFVCPTCGVTRMLTEIVTTFDLYQAFRYNPLMFILLPFIGILSIIEAISYINNGELTKHYDKLLSAIVILVLAFGILRNIPMLYWLLPTKI